MIINGILNIFKPKGISSFRVVHEIKKILNVKKVGHAGTLDPNASGVLLICLGQSTKISRFIMDLKKCYQGEMVLGITTDSQDSEGKIVKKVMISQDIDIQKIENIFEKYTGIIEQTPPMYSANHHQGKRLYKLAREGIEVQRKPKKVTIFRLSLLNLSLSQNPIIKFNVTCSKGTYVRTLCNDIGKDLGYGAYMSELVRTKIGKFDINDSITLETLEENKNIAREKLVDMDEILEHFNRIIIKPEFEDWLLNGGFIFHKHILHGSELKMDTLNQIVKVKNSKGKILSIARQALNDEKEIIFKPVRVFSSK